MGNYCSRSQEKTKISTQPAIKRKLSLKDPTARRVYEQNITSVLNEALHKYQKWEVKKIDLKGTLGKGGQASVFLVSLVLSGKFNTYVQKDFAMKRISKKRLNIARVKAALLLENHILSSHTSQYLSKIEYAFQDSTYLYYVMEIARGGDLSTILYPEGQCYLMSPSLSKNWLSIIRFILAGVILGLEYLHNIDIMYLDLKPENILLYSDGYPRLADFGVAQSENFEQKKLTVKGTLLYCSPEMLKKQGYTRSTDLWSFGILAYEMISGKTPFSQNMLMSRYFQRACQDFQMNPIFGSCYVPEELRDLILKLLKWNPEHRLGYNSFKDIKSHPFFAQIDWQKMEKKSMESPLRELIREKLDCKEPHSGQLDDLISIESCQRLTFTYVRDSNDSVSGSSLDKNEFDGVYQSEAEQGCWKVVQKQ